MACSALGPRSREGEVLVASGLAAWMKAWSALTAPSIRPPAAAAGEALLPACSEIVTLLADMAMSAAEEVLA